MMTFSHSEQLDQLALNLSKAQGEMQPAIKDANNPFFKSKYADLSSCIEASRGVMSKYGLSIVQSPCKIDNELMLTTMVLHASGQWIKSSMPIVQDKPGIQALGAAITYIRRYTLTSNLGISQEDDDANSASNNGAVAAARSGGKVTQIEKPTHQNCIQPIQVSLLETVLCKIPDYRVKLFEYLKTVKGINDINSIPSSMFDGIMFEAKKFLDTQKKAAHVVNA